MLKRAGGHLTLSRLITMIATRLMVQGSAADLMKVTTANIRSRLRSRGLHEHARLVLQVHDELIYEVAAEHLPAVAALVVDAMRFTLRDSLRVPLEVKVAAGARWSDLRPYTVERDDAASATSA